MYALSEIGHFLLVWGLRSLGNVLRYVATSYVTLYWISEKGRLTLTYFPEDAFPKDAGPRTLPHRRRTLTIDYRILGTIGLPPFAAEANAVSSTPMTRAALSGVTESFSFLVRCAATLA